MGRVLPGLRFAESRAAMSRRAPRNVAPIITPLYTRYWFQLTTVMGSMLGGASIVHNIYQPDIRIPELQDDGSRKDGNEDHGKEFLRKWREGETIAGNDLFPEGK